MNGTLKIEMVDIDESGSGGRHKHILYLIGRLLRGKGRIEGKGAFLVAQWLGIHLPMQGTQV